MHTMTPYCFPPTAFEAEAFRPLEFLEECQSRHPIAQVHRDLEAFKRSLENQLVAIIDKDYAEFLQLSTKLKGVNSAVSSLREPLVVIMDRVLAVQAAAADLVDKADTQIRDLQRLEQTKADLGLTITLCEKLDLVESLLHVASGDGPASSSEDDSDMEDDVYIPMPSHDQAQVLERVAKLTVELQYQIALGADVPSVQAEEPRMSAIERVLREKLEAELATEIVPDSFYARDHVINVINVNRLLRAYVALQETAVPEEMVGRLLVQPFLDSTMTRSRLDGRSRGSCEGLGSIYSAILEFVTKTLGGVLALPVCQGSAKNSVDLLTQSIWKPVSATLCEKLPEIFIAYNPDRMYHNYSASTGFLTSLEALCTSGEARTRLRLSAAPFYDKWNLDVYYQLRHSELTQALSTSFGQRPPDATFLQETRIEEFVFPSAKQVALLARKCFRDGVLLAAQTPKFARLSLELVAAFVQYWQPPLTTAQRLAAEKESGMFGTVNHSCVASADDVFACGNDLHRLQSLIASDLVPELRRRLTHAVPSEEAGVLATSLLAQSLKDLADLEAICWDIAANLVTDDCMKLLPAVRTIKGQYQMTNKPMPSTPSLYVATIVKPLESFLAKWGAPLRDNSGFAQRVLFATCSTYASLALELLKSAAELEESLKSRKLQRASVGISAASKTTATTLDGVSDTDKMRRQVELDMLEFGRLARALHVEMDKCDEYAAILRHVESA
ncbi:hypothetical protein SPRG_07390 [Saprolegnia parasitica CBS 223.65]|uniref:Conserved oligomeric Golgi complex subunit 2 n=1 Tax=Saprolegnia parasitica (strain CBS 223.65) TaxID=695850 RepID=A0A067CMN7_SAPPC|nr:hypothetical protein SPRG_07390 [Saprolegnia parasitica CBS 223.65]KDO27791.1 hypothetical protein SPRG_07390 [Saprolegnia parasitica CBS 223.65]|eukprot:XP_012201566.1 hypothetical protein SPRG_07390 [Saprolegnia parasitica CBS 223.65]